ncbi:hypothetical protein ACHAW5_003088 [Stephanodiscus triporus]|uniref:Uncharacterized protein n=1 Tax=Stephanodiscus triporus TaxID=2934178 RepID=A0ABD3MBQ6_9STRA
MDSILNNALNLFPVTQTPQQAQVKLQKLTHTSTGRGPTEIQKILASSLYDDGVEYMSTLDMNRAASYTFGYRNSHGGGRDGTTTLAAACAPGGPGGSSARVVESVADEMWELLVDLTLSKYARHSPLALTKTICLTQHVLLHGSEACAMDGEILRRVEMAVEPLRSLNTALVERRVLERILNSDDDGASSSSYGGDDDVFAPSPEGLGHQLSQLGTRASATMLRLRGGSVDKGHPVRTAASKLYDIISNPNNLRQMRMTLQRQQQPGDSLVPIGSAKQVGYITDEGRYRVLQEKMAVEERALRRKQYLEQQRMNQTRSNLAGTSATDSFGGGYTSNAGGVSGGKLVVGAAHSLADMIESARYQLEQHKTRHNQEISSLRKGYSDDPSARARRLEELERNRVEYDPEFIRKEKALQDALEYLEEMLRLEQEKVGDLLDGVLSGSNNDGMESGGTAFGDNTDGADLLGFDGGAAPRVDVFGGGPSSFAATGNLGADASADLLGFGGLNSGGPISPQPLPTNSTVTGYVVGQPINLEYNSNETHVGGIAGNSSSLNMRPSLVTGIIGGAGNGSNLSGVLVSPHLPSVGGVHGTMQDEEAEAEKSRKINLAEVV